jgi:hypothetical protein
MFPPGYTIRRALARRRTTTPATVTNHLVRCSRSVIITPYVVFRASLLGRRTYFNARYSISEIHAMTIGTEWLPRYIIDLSGVQFHDKHMQAVFHLACKDYVAYQQDLRGRKDPILKYEHQQPKTIDTPTAPRCVYIPPLTAKLGARGFKTSGIICLRLQKSKRSVTVTLVGEMPSVVEVLGQQAAYNYSMALIVIINILAMLNAAGLCKLLGSLILAVCAAMVDVERSGYHSVVLPAFLNRSSTPKHLLT